MKCQINSTTFYYHCLRLRWSSKSKPKISNGLKTATVHGSDQVNYSTTRNWFWKLGMDTHKHIETGSKPTVAGCEINQYKRMTLEWLVLHDAASTAVSERVSVERSGTLSTNRVVIIVVTDAAST